MLIFEDRLVLSEDLQLVALYVVVGTGFVEHSHVVMGPDQLSCHRLNPDPNNVLARWIKRTVEVEHYAKWARNSVAVSSYDWFVEVHPDLGYVEVTLASEDFAVDNFDVVVDYLCEWLDPQESLVDIRKVAKVKEVFDGSGRRSSHCQGASIHVSSIWIVKLGHRKQMLRRVS